MALKHLCFKPTDLLVITMRDAQHAFPCHCDQSLEQTAVVILLLGCVSLEKLHDTVCSFHVCGILKEIRQQIGGMITLLALCCMSVWGWMD